ncbi:hypothetical protein HOY81_21345 [Streptomyces sp. JJ36]|nr:hypothetical protein [Streptomyces sp. JJ36]
MERASGNRSGNRYDEPMVVHDVSAARKQQSRGGQPPAAVLRSASATALLGAFGCGAARLHVDLCRLASAACRRCAAARP